MPLPKGAVPMEQMQTSAMGCMTLEGLIPFRLQNAAITGTITPNVAIGLGIKLVKRKASTQ